MPLVVSHIPFLYVPDVFEDSKIIAQQKGFLFKITWLNQVDQLIQ